MRGRIATRRSRYVRPERTTILIVGEGKETEPNYFESLAKEDSVRTSYAVCVEAGPGFSPLRVVEHAVKVRNRKSSEFDEVWCVLDVEGRDKADSLKAAQTLAANEDITLVLSNPSFEVWLLLHFEMFTREFSNGRAAEAALDQKWKNEFGEPYSKSGKIYERLKSRAELGLKNATQNRTLHGGRCMNSSTMIDQFVARLRTPR